MDEDGAPKAAPLTRLRRRLSVETEDVKSPSTPSTPTKKRGRLAAKPQLELIDENALDSTPSKRTTRKSLARDVEEKPVTPARRSARVKSNTSIVSETTQSIDSPRAKRAARRLSQVGSDNELPLTPARTRKARKDSTSSIDNKGDSVSKPITEIAETIVEESESKNKNNSVNSSKSDSSNPVRKSPRLKTKQVEEPIVNKDQILSLSNDIVDPSKTKTRKSKIKEQSETSIDVSSTLELTTNEDKKDQPVKKSTRKSISMSSEEPQNKSQEPVEKGNILSASHFELIESCNAKPRNENTLHSKSMPALKDENPVIKRRRTLSCTTVAHVTGKDIDFSSDNEGAKRKSKKNGQFEIKTIINGSGDGVSKDTLKSNDSGKKVADDSSINLNSSIKRKKKNSEKSYTDTSVSKPDESVVENDNTNNTSTESNKENVPEEETSSTEIDSLKLIENSSTDKYKFTVVMEDTDSNSEIIKSKIIAANEDQCVPVVEHSDKHLDSSKLNLSNPSEMCINIPKQDIFLNRAETSFTLKEECEPMDVDETIPEVLFEANSSLMNKSKRKSSGNIADNQNIHKSRNNSLRKSSGVNSNEVDDTNINYTSSSMRKTSESFEESLNNKSRNESLQKSSGSIANDIDGQHNVKSRNNSIRKSSGSIADEVDSQIINKSKRKSSLSNSVVQTEKTSAENKSTLILSQIKDNSAIDQNVSNNELLSKSLNVSNVPKENVLKNNLSIGCLTSTPIQDKNSVKPNGKKLPNGKSLSNKSVQGKNGSKYSDSELSTSESEDENGHKNFNSLVDDEAEEASDDYESGDSQNESEREYTKNNEILEKGETLTSDDDISNDSDYEKDSFIVSSDDEDNNLLDGSGDDLSMSDNELKMTAKSKKKYNERMVKEQKNASREMYESRHKIKSSSKAEKSQKRRRLDSSVLESADESIIKSKQSNRQRINSSHDSNSDLDVSKKKKKSRPLSESFDGSQINDNEVTESLNDNSKCLSTSITTKIDSAKKNLSKRSSSTRMNISVTNEKEISIANNNQDECEDPLLIKVKKEPKTPQKSLDLSTIHFTHAEEVEQVNVDGDESIQKFNESVDPLQATLAQNGFSSSESENEEIMQNYDSILKELNEDKKSKYAKTHDISLGSKKVAKKKQRDIVDDLNLTTVKEVKQLNKNTLPKTNQNKPKVQSTSDEASSDLIDMHLLFSDSDASEDKTKKTENKDDIFIPLKKATAKTNLRKSESMDDEGEALDFFVDTKGDHSHIDAGEKNNKSNISIANNNKEDSDSEPEEVSYQSQKKNWQIHADNMTEKPVTLSKKKKKLLSQSLSEKTKVDRVEKVGNISLNIDGQRNKTKKLSESLENQHSVKSPATPESKLNTSNQHGSEKKKRLSESNTDKLGYAALSIISQDKIEVDKEKTPKKELEPTKDHGETVEVGKKRKRKSSANNTQEIEENTVAIQNTDEIDPQINSRKNKKQKISENDKTSQGPELTGEKQGALKNNKRTPNAQKSESEKGTAKINRKRKERDVDGNPTDSKILKKDILQEVHVPRLPSLILDKLEDKSSKEKPKKKSKVVSTTQFVVEEAIKRKNKPSNYLEESIYMNDLEELERKQKVSMKKPKVLPFLPTASTSSSGFTTVFKVNILPSSHMTKFVAQADKTNKSFKDNYLDNKRKKLGTYELYKKNRNMKLSKF